MRDAASDALNGMGMAAVIVVVASVMRDAVREQLGSGEDEARCGEAGRCRRDGEQPAAAAACRLRRREPTPAPPPTWTQEVLGRLLRRAGGQP